VIASGIDNNLHGASWSSDGTILFAEDRGIYRVPANGGTPEPLFQTAEGERFNGPQLLPDGDTVLYSVAETSDWDRALIVAQSISTGDRTVLVEGGSSARYVDTGHIVYSLGADLFAKAFDADSLTVHGSVVPLVQGVSRAILAFSGLANYGITRDGTLIYLAGSAADSSLSLSPVWVDRDGREQATGVEGCTCVDPGAVARWWAHCIRAVRHCDRRRRYLDMGERTGDADAADVRAGRPA
jgi:hypothetical protein